MFSLSRHNFDGSCFNGEDSVSRDPGLSRTLMGLRVNESLCKQVIESPAKIFAKMKARVQLERILVEDNGSNTQKHFRKERVTALNLPRKIHHPWPNCEQKETNTCEFEHKDLTLSPVKSPRKGLSHPHFDIRTPKKCPPLDAVTVAQSPREIFSRLKDNNTVQFTRGSEVVTLSTGKLPRKPLTNPQTVIHAQDRRQPRPLKEMGSGAFIPTDTDKATEDPALEALSIQSPPKAFSYPLSRLKLMDTGKEALPKDLQCGAQATNGSVPASRSTSTDSCKKKVDVCDFVHEESYFKSHALERLPSQDFPSNTFFLLKERGRKEQEDNGCLDPMNKGGGARVRCTSTSVRVPEGDRGDASAAAAFCVSPETGSPASPEAGPSRRTPPPPPLPGGRPGLLHDPLLQLTPKFSIPKKRRSECQAKPTVSASGPSSMKNCLKDWILKRLGSGVYVKGFHMNQKLPWQSNIITERISSNTLKTTTGSTYVLVGPMALGLSENEFPKYMLKKFLFGFPKNWKECIRDFFSEPKGSQADGNEGGKKKTPPAQNHVSKRSSSTSQKPKPKRSVSCSATSEADGATSEAGGATSGAGGAKVSRSGRLLKPPLEYWKGARVILDCDLNVTVHEGYDTFSVPNPQQRKPLARVVSQGPPKPAVDSLPPGEGLLQADTGRDGTVLLRKVKACHRRPKTQSGNDAPQPAPTSLPCAADDNDPPRGPRRPQRARLASQRSKAEASHSAKHPGPPGMTQQSMNPPRHTRRSAEKQSSSDDSELLPGQLVKGQGKAGRPRVFDLPLEGVRQKKPGDEVEMERTVAGRHAARLRSENLGGRHGSVTEAQSNDDAARKKKPKTGSMMPRGLRARGRVLGNSDSSPSALLTSPDDLNGDLSKRESQTDDDDHHHRVARKEDSKTMVVELVRLRVPRKRGSLRGDPMSTSPDDSQTELTKRESQSDDAAETKGTMVNTPLTRTRGRASSHNSKKEFTTRADGGLVRKTRAKAKRVEAEPVNPRNKRTRGRAAEGSLGASRELFTSSDDDFPKRACPGKRRGKDRWGAASQQEEMKENHDQWTEEELLRLHEAVMSIPKHVKDFWVKVAFVVSTRSAGECQEQFNAQAPTCPRPRGTSKTKKVQEPSATEPPRITARKGTLKRKQQVRNLMDQMPKDDHDDIFNSSPMLNKRVKLPTHSLDGTEDVFMRSEHDPQTPGSSGFPSVKTPQCLHITPGMMGSRNRNDDDKYIYQLQKRMKKSQAKLHKIGAAPKCTTTPSAKSVLRRCNMDNDSSMLVWKMFEGDPSVDSGEEEDYYFGEED